MTDNLEERLREKWGEDLAVRQERGARARSKGAEDKPLPVRVEVERIEQGFPTRSVWFLYGIAADGTRDQILNTSLARLAEEEVKRFQGLGIPVGVHKPWR